MNFGLGLNLNLPFMRLFRFSVLVCFVA